MYLQIDDVEPLEPEEIDAELSAQEEKGPALPNVGGIPCYDLSRACVRGIAKIYGIRDEPQDWALWLLANGEQVGPEYVHDNIDQIIDSFDAADYSSDAEARAARTRELLMLKGWLYLQVHNSPHDFVRHPERFQLKITSISVRDLIGRRVANRHGREFKIIDVRYDLEMGKVSFELADLDDDGHVISNDTTGIFALEGWTVL